MDGRIAARVRWPGVSNDVTHPSPVAPRQRDMRPSGGPVAVQTHPVASLENVVA